MNEDDDDKEGVLLYYKYVDLCALDKGGREGLFEWMKSNCERLKLVGRVRVAYDGLNATLGGKIGNLRAHVRQLVQRDPAGFDGTDFKLQVSAGAVNDDVEIESGFHQLSVQLTKEVVTMGERAVGIKPDQCAKHLKPEEFHRLLDGSEAKGEDVVLVDVRNIYESRIGHFALKGVNTLFPETRTFSQFPKWIDAVESDLRHKKILMYCTGGVRCERASAYIKSKGPAFHDCFQLEGGIQRYLEQYPDGGHFKGKNFVFDSRSSVGPTGGPTTRDGEGGYEAAICTDTNKLRLDSKEAAQEEKKIVGKCMQCEHPHDSYGARVRCNYCRLLILLCPQCLEQLGPHAETQKYCEICRSSSEKKEKKKATTKRRPSKAASTSKAASPLPSEGKKLKILCLHGFRQTAKSFRGRTAAMRKRMKKVVDFVYIDAPFAIQDYNQSEEGEGQQTADAAVAFKRSWLLAHENATNFEASYDEALLKQQEMNSDRDENAKKGKDATGWETSFGYLKKQLRSLGPIDGILGFSQGAAITGLYCAAMREEGLLEHVKFVILCSGYKSKAHSHIFGEDLEEGEEKANSKQYIMIPSLHVIGGSDKQISVDRSEELADCFDPGSRSMLRHDQGHIIPSSKSYVEDYVRFLEQFF